MVWQWLRVDKEHLFSGEQAKWPLDDYDLDSESLLLLLYHIVSACCVLVVVHWWPPKCLDRWNVQDCQDTSEVLGCRAGMSFADGNKQPSWPR